ASGKLSDSILRSTSWRMWRRPSKGSQEGMRLPKTRSTLRDLLSSAILRNTISNPPRNITHKWTPAADQSLYPKPTRYRETDPPVHRLTVASNGLTIAKQGRWIVCEHGNRRVTRLERDGSVAILVDHYPAKRLNSLNDVVVGSEPVIDFWDPPD